MGLKNQEEMSMEEILASIRQYVSTTNDRPYNDTVSKVVKLTEELVEDDEEEVTAPRIVETSAKLRSSPFSKLQEVKKVSEQETFFMQFFRDIVLEWLDRHPDFVEKAVHKAIKKELED